MVVGVIGTIGQNVLINVEVGSNTLGGIVQTQYPKMVGDTVQVLIEK